MLRAVGEQRGVGLLQQSLDGEPVVTRLSASEGLFIYPVLYPCQPPKSRGFLAL
jgi:hypothetical protein